MGDDLSHAKIVADRQTSPTTEAVVEKWEKHNPHAPACEMHTLAHAGHAPLGEGSVDVLLVLAESGDGGEHSGEAHVVLSPVKERRSSFEKLDQNS
jgi:hypothetical protein